MDLKNYPDILIRSEVSEVLKIGRYKTNELLYGGHIKVLKIGKSIIAKCSDYHGICIKYHNLSLKKLY